MIQMQLGYQLKTATSACISPKLPSNCSSVQQLEEQQQLDSLDKIRSLNFITYTVYKEKARKKLFQNWYSKSKTQD